MDASGLGVIASYTGAVSTIFVGVTLIWVASRTQSWHTIRYRLWLFVNGKGKVADAAVATTLQDEADLTAFRFFSMDADSLYDARSLIAWGESKRVSMSMLRACGDYFLRKELVLKGKLPSLKRAVIVAGLAWGIGSLVFALAVFGMLNSSAMLKFKDSGRWFLLQPHEARTLLVGNPVPVNDASCKASKGNPSSSFSGADGKILCQLSGDPKLEGYISETVRQQRITLMIFMVALLFVLSQFWGALYRLRSA